MKEIRRVLKQFKNRRNFKKGEIKIQCAKKEKAKQILKERVKRQQKVMKILENTLGVAKKNLQEVPI